MQFLPVAWRYTLKTLKVPTVRMGMAVAMLFCIAFFVLPKERTVGNAQITLLKEVVGEELADFEQKPRESKIAEVVKETRAAVRKKNNPTPIPQLILTQDSAIAAMPLAARYDETDPSLFVDDLPSVQGVAFLESMAPINIGFEDRTEIYSYTVESGDTLSSIADLFGISLDTLLWANNLTARSVIHEGDKISVLPVNGVAHTVAKGDTVGTIAKKYGVETNDILAFNNLSESDSTGLETGKILVIPDGRRPADAIASATKKPTPSTAPIVVQVTKNVNAPTGWLLQPAPGYNWGRRHGFNGDDIANACGTPIVAAAAGKVILSKESGWNGGYGKYIKIQHSNGVITLYAHAQELFVDEGVEVEQGQTIMLMGTTGRSTGCHVHFEVRGAKNPFVRR